MSSATSYEQFKFQLARLLMVSEEELDSTALAEIKNYDSLGRIEVSALVEDSFGFLMSQTDSESCKTARDLYNLAVSKR